MQGVRIYHYNEDSITSWPIIDVRSEYRLAIVNGCTASVGEENWPNQFGVNSSPVTNRTLNHWIVSYSAARRCICRISSRVFDRVTGVGGLMTEPNITFWPIIIIDEKHISYTDNATQEHHSSMGNNIPSLVGELRTYWDYAVSPSSAYMNMHSTIEDGVRHTHDNWNDSKGT